MFFAMAEEPVVALYAFMFLRFLDAYVSAVSAPPHLRLCTSYARETSP
jgi:hypothetical protein